MNVRKFELRLGSIQLVLLTSLFFLCIASAYYFGFSSGRTTGHEKALAASLAASPKTPLSPAEEPTSSLSSDDLYARLNEAPAAPPEEDRKIIETLELEEEQTNTSSVTLGDLVSDPLSKDDLRPLAMEPTPKPTEKPTAIPTIIPEPTAPPATPTIKATQKPSEASLPSGWFVQVAAPESRVDANGLIEKLRSNGFKASIEVALIRDQQYYRVLVGPESNKELAERLLKQVAREPYLQGTPFLKYVK